MPTEQMKPWIVGIYTHESFLALNIILVDRFAHLVFHL